MSMCVGERERVNGDGGMVDGVMVMVVMVDLLSTGTPLIYLLPLSSVLRPP